MTERGLLAVVDDEAEEDSGSKLVGVVEAGVGVPLEGEETCSGEILVEGPSNPVELDVSSETNKSRLVVEQKEGKRLVTWDTSSFELVRLALLLPVSLVMEEGMATGVIIYSVVGVEDLAPNWGVEVVLEDDAELEKE